MYINFQQNRVSRSVKMVHTTFICKKMVSCINLQLAFRISKNHVFRTCTIPQQIFRPNLRSIGTLDFDVPRIEIISRTTDGQTIEKIGIFFEFFLFKY